MNTQKWNIQFHNIAELEWDQESGGYKMPRMPLKVVEQLNEKAKRSIYFGCGCELRFQMISDEVKIYMSRFKSDSVLPNGIAEVWQGDFQGRYQLSPQPVNIEKSVITIKKMKSQFLQDLDDSRNTYSSDLYRVFLPYDYGNIIYGIEGEVKLPDQEQMPDQTVLLYGSSISHGSCSCINSGSYGQQLADHLHMNLRNAAMAGACYMDECAAKQIASEDWEIAVLELGINVVEKGWTREEFEGKCRRFIQIVSESRQKPVYVVSPYFSEKEMNHPDIVGGMRSSLERIVKEFQNPSIHYINGLDCLPDYHGLSSDGLHPAQSGINRIARALIERIRENTPQNVRYFDNFDYKLKKPCNAAKEH